MAHCLRLFFPRSCQPFLRVIGAACIAFAACACGAGRALASPFDMFVDPDDGDFDVSTWLMDKQGFLPVPIVITEPAVGYGGGLAAVFFPNSIRESASRIGPSGDPTPPDIFAVAAAATENGTKFGGLGGIASLYGDRFRYRGGALATSLNLDFYGLGNVLGGNQSKIGYNLQGWGTMQQGLVRLGSTNAWVSARWIYLDLASTLHTANPDDALLPDFAFAKRSSGIGPTFEYDSRDNIFTPSRGWTGSLDLTFYDAAWGSEDRFQSYRAHVFAYLPLGDRFVLGGRIDGRAARGDVPFYFNPFVDMRGVPAARLQDKNTAVVETELRWNLTRRWALIGFLGAGRAWGTYANFEGASTAVSQGGGFRYLLARRLGLWAGIDYAKSQYDHAVYLEIGNAWR